MDLADAAGAGVVSTAAGMLGAPVIDAAGVEDVTLVLAAGASVDAAVGAGEVVVGEVLQAVMTKSRTATSPTNTLLIVLGSL